MTVASLTPDCLPVWFRPIAVHVSAAARQQSSSPTPLQVLVSLHRAVLDKNAPLHDPIAFPVLAQSNLIAVSLVECELVTPPFLDASAAVPECRQLDWPADVVAGLVDLHNDVAYAGCTNKPEDEDELGYDAGDSQVVSFVGDVRLDNDVDEYTGLGYADFSSSLSGESLAFNLTECRPGQHTLGWRYSLAGSTWGDDDVQWLALIINGEQQPDLLRFQPNEVWESWSTSYAVVLLRGGSNIITLASAGWSGPKIDRLRCEKRKRELYDLLPIRCHVYVSKLAICKTGSGQAQGKPHKTGRFPQGDACGT